MRDVELYRALLGLTASGSIRTTKAQLTERSFSAWPLSRPLRRSATPGTALPLFVGSSVPAIVRRP